MLLADMVNEYTDANKPWELAKQDGADDKLHEVCSVLINSFKILSVYLSPILPATANAVAEFLNIPALQWADALNTLPENHNINEYKHLMKRVEQTQIDNLVEANKQSIAATPAAVENKADFEPVAPLCSFDDFTKVDMRVGKVLSCEAVEGSNKLLKFQIDLGFEQRTIFSGIAQSYPEPEKLVGRKVIAVVNFAPRKMAKFGISEGMLLSASSNGKLFLLNVEDGAEVGATVG